MPTEQKHLFTIEEVINSQSQYLSGMNRWLELIFPEYCPPRFDKLLLKHRHPNGRNQIQIFIGLSDGLVGGLIMFWVKQRQSALTKNRD